MSRLEVGAGTLKKWNAKGVQGISSAAGVVLFCFCGGGEGCLKSLYQDTSRHSHTYSLIPSHLYIQLKNKEKRGGKKGEKKSNEQNLHWRDNQM